MASYEELDKIKSTIDGKVIFYGSYVESINGFSRLPRDIDCIVVCNDKNGTSEIFVDGVELPINVEYLDEEKLLESIGELQPKFLLTYGDDAVVKQRLSEFRPHEVRSKISSFSSKAYAKGKKKLIVPEDYDMDLGLKNLAHAFKFRYLAMYKFGNTSLEECISETNEIHNRLYREYKEPSDLPEIEKWLKLEFNKVMTEFRKIFPKEQI